MGAAHFLGEYLMLRKSFPDERPEHPFDLHIHLGDEIDRALFIDLNLLSESGHLQLAGPDDGLDGRGEEERIRHHSAARA